VGDRYHRVHWKSKRPHERPKGSINRKVVLSWAWGGTIRKAALQEIDKCSWVLLRTWVPTFLN
jgi:hypothetical protein